MDNLKHKVSYHKIWDSNGTCYTQCITITVDELLKGFKSLAKRIPVMEYFGNSDYVMYAQSCREFKDGIYYANMTQTIEIIYSTDLYKEDRVLVDRNTCFKVVKG